MLYELYEMQRALLAPWTLWADAYSAFFSSPASPLTYFPFAQGIAAACELTYRISKDYPKPSFGIGQTVVEGNPVDIRERTVLTKTFCKLLHFEKDPAQQQSRTAHQPKVLLFAPLSGHHACLLRDTVRWLLPSHEVYITDWADARLVPASAGAFELDDYVRYAEEFMRLLAPGLHVIAICQPAVPVLAAVSLMASHDDAALPNSMTMMGGPINPSEAPNAVSRMARQKSLSWFERNSVHTVPPPYPGCGRRVYPGFLQHAGMVVMDPGRHARRHRDYYQHVVRGSAELAESDRQFYEVYNAMLDVPAEFYLDTIRHVFQEYSLARGTWKVGGEEVRPRDVRTVALLTVEGECDDIAPPGQTQAAHGLCSSLPAHMREKIIFPNCGHYGLFMGAYWRTMVGPRIAQFIKNHG